MLWWLHRDSCLRWEYPSPQPLQEDRHPAAAETTSGRTFWSFCEAEFGASVAACCWCLQVLRSAAHELVLAALPAVDELRSTTARVALQLFQVRLCGGLRDAPCWLLYAGQQAGGRLELLQPLALAVASR